MVASAKHRPPLSAGFRRFVRAAVVHHQAVMALREAELPPGSLGPAELPRLAAAGVVGDLFGLAAVVAAKKEIASAPVGRYVSNRLHDQPVPESVWRPRGATVLSL